MIGYPTTKMAASIMGILLTAPGTAQDIFTTDDFRADREHWTDPAYYRNNTVFEIRDMDRDSDFGEEGTGRVGAADLASPYPYTSAWEHYQAWLAEADGSGHTREDFQYPRWHGESIGFWDGDTLVVHTNQVRGWKGALTEFSDALETVERYRRVGDTIEGEITRYDPEILVRPAFSRLAYELDTDTRPELRPLYNSCTDSNGPAPKIHMDERGILNERLQGDPLYWDATDPRPWATWLNESDERYRRYRESLDAGDTESRAN